MKKIIGLALVALMAAAMLVSCSAEVRNDGIARITLSNASASKGIVATESTEEEDARELSSYTWTYTAVPASASQLGYGRQDEEKEMDEGDSVTLNLSYGTWTFTLYGYDVVESAEEDGEDQWNLVYMGSESNVVVGSASKTVVVNVDKLTDENAPEGKDLAPATVKFFSGDDESPFKIVSGDDEIADASLNNSTNAYLFKVVVRDYENEENDELIPCDVEGAVENGYIYSPSAEMNLEPGLYKIIVEYWDGTNFARTYEYLTFKAGQVYDLSGTLELVTVSEVTINRGKVNINVFESSDKDVVVATAINVSESDIVYHDSIDEDLVDEKINVYTYMETNECDDEYSVMKIVLPEDSDAEIDLKGIVTDKLVVEIMDGFTGKITTSEYLYYNFIQHVDVEGEDKSYSFDVGFNEIWEQTSVLGWLNYCDDGIDTIVIPDGIEVIGCGAFYGIGSDDESMTFTKVVIPETVVAIHSMAFDQCENLEEIYIPASVEMIDENFIYCGCTSLERFVVADGNTCFMTVEGVLFDKEQHVLVHWPSTLEYDSDLLSENIEAVCGGAFRDNISSEIVLPDSVVYIGPSAFECSSIESFEFPEGYEMMEIAEGLFRYCENLESIEIPECVTRIGLGAFEGCTSLESVYIPDGVEDIESGAFSGCSSLNGVVIPDGVMVIADATFQGCSGLTSITIPSEVSVIGSNAFCGCTGLTEITIPYSVQRIDSFAFGGCSNLITVRYEGSKEEWEGIVNALAFYDVPCSYVFDYVQEN